MRIAVDAAGGDHGPAVIVVGAVDGARRFGVDLLLTGAEAEIRHALAGRDVTGIDVIVADAPETIGGDEQAAQAVRRKPRSAIAVALDAVRDGHADAMVSAGNSGAVMAGALLKLGRIRGVDRPAIAGHLPSMTGRTLVLDMGAVADPRPQHLVQSRRWGVSTSSKRWGWHDRRWDSYPTARSHPRETSSCRRHTPCWPSRRESISG